MQAGLRILCIDSCLLPHIIDFHFVYTCNMKKVFLIKILKKMATNKISGLELLYGIFRNQGN